MARFEKKVYTEIDRYLRGQMTPEERMDYEIKLSLDPELQKEVRFQDFLVRSLAYGRRRQLHQYLFENASTKLWGNSWGRTGTIVSLIVVLLAAIAFFVVNSQRSNRTNVPDKDDTRLENRLNMRNNNAPAVPAETIATQVIDTTQTTIEDTTAAEPAAPTTDATEPEDEFSAIPPPKEAKEIDDPQDFIEQTGTSDTIKGDVLIKEIVLPVAPLEKHLADSFNITPGNAPSLGYDDYRVQLWESPVNFKGYKVEQKKITLYGLDKNQQLHLRRVGNNLFLLTGAKIYELQQTQSFKPLKPITPPKASRNNKKKK